MDRSGENTSMFLTAISCCVGSREQNPGPVSLSESLGPPAPQTSLIVRLSGEREFILGILYYVALGPPFTRYFTPLRIQYGMRVDGDHQLRVQSLLPLSRTCKAMRLRLLSWIWERIECLEVDSPQRETPRKLNAIMKALNADPSLVTSVRFLTVARIWNSAIFPTFIKCLKSLPNLHTLEIGEVDVYATPSLKAAVKRVKLPQIKSVILPHTAYPLLGPCHNVEDVVCVVWKGDFWSENFCRTLASNRHSKVKRLAIPLVLPGSPSRYVAALPKLAELILLYPHPHDELMTKTGVSVSEGLATKIAISEVVSVCTTFREFEMLHLVNFLLFTPTTKCINQMLGGGGLPGWQQREDQVMAKVDAVKDLALESLRKANYQSALGKRITFKVIELTPSTSRGDAVLLALDVEVCR